MVLHLSHAQQRMYILCRSEEGSFPRLRPNWSICLQPRVQRKCRTAPNLPSLTAWRILEPEQHPKVNRGNQPTIESNLNQAVKNFRFQGCQDLFGDAHMELFGVDVETTENRACGCLSGICLGCLATAQERCVCWYICKLLP